MSLKRIIGTFLIGLCAASAASAAPVATAASSAPVTFKSAQKTIPCSEYKRLTGLDVCYVKPELLVAQARYDALVKTFETGTCLDAVAQTYGTLECRRLGDAFQAWQGRDVTDCQQAVLQCRGVGADRMMTRVKIERTEIPTARARFHRLGLAYGEVTK